MSNYLLKTLKYHLYKRRTGRPSWNATYLFERACRRLGPGDVTIDAGANVGDVAQVLAATGATVHAFEPDPFSFGKLQARFSISPNVHLHQQALADQSGTLRLYRAKDFETDPILLSQSSSLFSDKKNISTDEFFDVETVDVVDFIKRLNGPVKILKLDVEGAEVPILEALLASDVMGSIDLIFAETHETKIPQLADRSHAVREAVRRDWANKVNLDWH